MERFDSARASGYSDGTPVMIDDVTTAMQMYQQVSGSFVAPQFPEWPTVVPIDDRTFILRTNSPVPVLDSLMSNILITPAAANEPNELQSGIGSWTVRRQRIEPGHRRLHTCRQ